MRSKQNWFIDVFATPRLGKLIIYQGVSQYFGDLAIWKFLHFEVPRIKFLTFSESQDNSEFKTILTFDLWWKFAMVENENENLNLTCLNEHKSDFFWIYNKYKNTQILFWNIGCYFPTLGGWINTKTYFWTLLWKFCVVADLTFILRRS